MQSPPIAISYIRFSSLEQRKGDSYNRQYQRTKDFCVLKGWHLTDVFFDEGVSAFRSRNKDEGELGKLIVAIREGKIPKGAFLIIESLDRMSRDKVRTQVGLFLEILSLGINVVTLTDGVIHHAEEKADDYFGLMLAMASMHRANDESEVKSQRVGSAWKTKRKNALEKPLTKATPAWLTIENGKIVSIPERAAVIVEIFKDSASGMGRRSIAKKLNERREQVWGSVNRNKAGLWNDSYIAKILANRAVLGEYQPHTKRSGQPRYKEGDPLLDYYPRVIDDQTFYACQARAEERKGKGGASAPKARNLFNFIARCAVCGGKTQFTDKGVRRNLSGKVARPERYLQCRASHLGSQTCSEPRVRYDQVEQFMLAVVMNGQWSNLFNPHEDQERETVLLEAKEGEMLDLTKKIEYLLGELEGGRKSAAIRSRLDEYESKVEDLKRDIEKVKAVAAANLLSKSAYDDGVFASLSTGENDIPARREIKLRLERCVDAVYLQKKESGAVGLFVVLKSGMFLVGIEEKTQAEASRVEIALCSWQLDTRGPRIVMHYEFKEDRDANLRPYPKARKVREGEDLIAQYLSANAAIKIAQLGYHPKEKPNFFRHNRSQLRLLSAQRKDFAALEPDQILYDFSDPLSQPKAASIGEEWRPFDEKERIQKVEENFKNRLA